MTASVTLSNGDPLPSFMIFNAVTNMLSGFADLIHINTWTLAYVATDAQGITGETLFKLNIYCKLESTVPINFLLSRTFESKIMRYFYYKSLCPVQLTNFRKRFKKC